TGLPDSDGDGIPDGLEVRYGLDPLKPDVGFIDTDGDGQSDLAEFKANSDPTQRDHDFFLQYGYQYQTVARPQTDGAICYDFSVSNLSLVPPPSSPGRRQVSN